MSNEALKFREAVLYSISFIMLLWLVKAIEVATSMELGFLGILPRTLIGTVGIFTAPLIHGDLLHLLSNSFPLLLLGIGVIYFYNKIALEVIAWIYLLTGISVWLLARAHYHIGASGLVYGLLTFLFFSGIFRRDSKSVSVSLIIIFMYSGMIMGVFPLNQDISWESHLMGSLAGIFCAIYFRRSGLPAVKPVAVEQEVQNTPHTLPNPFSAINFSDQTESSYHYEYAPKPEGEKSKKQTLMPEERTEAKNQTP